MRVRVYSQKSEASNKIMSNWQGMQSNSLNKSINTVPTIFPGFLMIYGSLTETKTLLLYKKKKIREIHWSKLSFNNLSLYLRN